MDSTVLREFRLRISDLNLDRIDERDVDLILKDDAVAEEFLTKRKFDIGEAATLAEIVLEWRKKNGVNDMTHDDIPREFCEKRSMFARGKCKDGHRIVYFIGRRFLKEEKEEARKMFIFLLERIRREGSKVTFILDASECSMANVDVTLIRNLVDCFMTYFPGLLGRTFVVDLPGILTAIWNLVKIWFDEEIRMKTITCQRSDLSQYVKLKNLHSTVGGEDSWEPSNVYFDADSEGSGLIDEREEKLIQS